MRIATRVVQLLVFCFAFALIWTFRGPSETFEGKLVWSAAVFVISFMVAFVLEWMMRGDNRK